MYSRRGSHDGNRFKVRLRDCQFAREQAQQRWAKIISRGVPNYFGAQRFGRRGDNIRQAQEMFGGAKQVRDRMLRGFGVLYQSGALWSSMTLMENVSLPLREHTRLTEEEIRDIAAFKLSLVGLYGFEDHYPSEVSGGMKKRAGLARAMALDPEILFFDEPSAGLDPISSRLLDDLILELRESLGTTVVMVTHELASIFAIGNNSVFLDPVTKTMIAQGDPKRLLAETNDERVREFLSRGEA